MRPALGTRPQLVVFVLALAVFLTLFIRWRSAPDASPVPVKTAGTAASPSADAPDVVDRSFGKGRSPSAEKTPRIEDIQIVNKSDFDNPPPRVGPSSRNPFDLRAPTPIPPPTPTPAPPPPPPAGSVAFVGPMPPPPPTPTPMPPAINFRFIGTFGPKDRPFAVLVLNDQIVNARAGEVVFDQFILRRVGYESIDIGFVGRRVDDIRRMAIAP